MCLRVLDLSGWTHIFEIEVMLGGLGLPNLFGLIGLNGLVIINRLIIYL